MTMPIDVRQVDWLYVVILALFALVANLIANLLSFRRRGLAAVLAAVLFNNFVRRRATRRWWAAQDRSARRGP